MEAKHKMKNQKSVIERIKDSYASFTKSQKIIGNYIFEKQEQVIYSSALQMSKELGVSDATIIRFARDLGYEGFTDMRNALRREQKAYEAPDERLLRYKELLVGKGDSLISQVANADLRQLEHFYNTFDYSLLDAVVEEIYKANKIHIVGIGTDSTVATLLEWYLNVMGFDTECYVDGGFGFARKMTNLKKEDLLIICTTPRHLNDETSIIRIAKKRGTKIVCIAPSKASETTFLCDILLPMENEEHSFLNSYVPYISLCNLLLIKVYEKDEERIMKHLKGTSQFIEQFNLY